MKRLSTAAALCLVAALYPVCDVETAEKTRRPSSVRVEHDQHSFASTIIVPAHDGRFAWGDVIRGVARLKGYDDTALEPSLPNWSVKADGSTARFLIEHANRSLQPDISLAVVQHQSAKTEPQLVITLDREAMLATRRQRNQAIREAILPKSYNGRAYGIQFDEKDERYVSLASDAEVVIFVHGLNSHPHTVAQLCDIAQRNGLAAARFHYPNDQPLDDSALLLSQELKRWKQLYPQRRVSLVTHSMGGLVARAAIENPQLDPGNVSKLIMVSPPNHGSNLSQFACGLDIWEYLDEGNRDSSQTCVVYSSLEDGLSEATVDLEPGSIFLTKLNRRQRNARVQYSIFLGTGGPCTRDELDDFRRTMNAGNSWCSWWKCLTSRLDPAIADLDEVVTGYGDGAVAVKRGRLAGVEDTVVMKFDHVSVLRDMQDREVQRVYAEVLARLKQ
jgi:pimeloyl-ACP methyl ester carboxylesterase